MYPGGRGGDGGCFGRPYPCTCSNCSLTGAANRMFQMMDAAEAVAKAKAKDAESETAALVKEDKVTNPLVLALGFYKIKALSHPCSIEVEIAANAIEDGKLRNPVANTLLEFDLKACNLLESIAFFYLS
ncbi:hypothetical protein RIF29_24062 [Crotalaria pallida]|uniref:Uncharacterized protein n=1 Tax=Crotalaria pallida TaxID=3830 RepID=A0AAN9ER85_CROPI